jgi:hypothetical protein
MKLLTTPDELGPCQVYCEQLKDEVRRLRRAIQTALDSPCMMGADDIEVLTAALTDTSEAWTEPTR